MKLNRFMALGKWERFRVCHGKKRIQKDEKFGAVENGISAGK